MDADEREIVDFLNSFHAEWVSGKEICRRAGGKRRFNEDKYWAIPVLQRLRDRRIVEIDMVGHYRLTPPPEESHDQEASLDTQRILKAGGGTTDLDGAGAGADESGGRS